MNAEGYTTSDGKHLTRYECTQHMRQLETRLRRAKEGQIAFKTSGDMKTATRYQAKINNLITEYSTFCSEAKMKPRWERAFVDGYKPLKKDEYEY